MTNVSKQLSEGIAAGVADPKAYRFVTHEKSTSRTTRPLVRTSQQGFARTVEAPQAYITVRFNIRVTSSLDDLEAAEEQLNEAVPDICSAIEGYARAQWTDAVKIIDPDLQRLAYDITTTYIARKEP